MNILVIGGTRFMGKHLVKELLRQGHMVTIATRGIVQDNFADSVKRLTIDRMNEDSLQEGLKNTFFDVIYDSLAYSSNDIRRLLDIVTCNKYIMISTAAVYEKYLNTVEEAFDPLGKTLIWCDREDFPYDEIKRQAECALFQEYAHVHSVAVRFPFVIGADDYTGRLQFYIEHIIKGKPMNVDNFHKQMSFVRSQEAGSFLAYLAADDYSGAINGASEGTISIKDIADYVESRTGKKVILSPGGEEAPYNGVDEYSINTDKASSLGFVFSPLKAWIYDLIDGYIEETAV